MFAPGLILAIFALGALLSAVLTAVSWSRRHVPGAKGLFGLVASAGIWILCDGLRQLVDNPTLENLLNRCAYLGIAPVPLAWLMFAFEYGGHEKAMRRWFPPLASVSALTILLALTNQSHHLIWRHYTVQRVDGLLTMQATYGPAFWAFWVYTEAALLVGSYLLLSAGFGSMRLYRRQSLAALIGIGIPWIVNIKYVLRIPPLADFDWSPVSFAFSGLFFSYAVYRERLLDLLPVAHHKVINGMADGVIVTDHNGRIVEWNPAAADAFHLHTAGATLPQSLGIPADSSVPQVLELPSGRSFEVRAHDLDPGRPAGTVYVFREITAHLAVERELRALKEKAEQASAAKSDFLAVMSHELRTPLHAIIGTADVLHDSPLPGDHRDGIHTIRNAADSLLTLVNDILDLSRIEARRLQLDPADFLLRDLIDQTLDVTAAAAHEKNLDLHAIVDHRVPARLLADPARLRQILINLLVNAIKFTDSGSVTLAVTLADPQQIRFAVTDTGIGIPEQKLPELFQPFTQLDPSVRRRHGGSGLGLVISKRLAALMHGNLGVESREHHGSTFWLEIPLTPGSPASPELRACPVAIQLPSGPTRHAVEELLRHWGAVLTTENPAATITPDAAIAPIRARTLLRHIQHTLAAEVSNLPLPVAAPPTDARILLAEDNLVNQHVASVMLRKLGYAVDVASNGAEAVDAFTRHHYDAILMDCRMPEMDGFEATRRIRQQDQSGRTIIIALTADALSDVQQRCRQAGMDDYLAKPVHLAQLAATLQKWLA